MHAQTVNIKDDDDDDDVRRLFVLRYASISPQVVISFARDLFHGIARNSIRVTNLLDIGRMNEENTRALVSPLCLFRFIPMKFATPAQLDSSGVRWIQVEMLLLLLIPRENRRYLGW